MITVGVALLASSWLAAWFWMLFCLAVFASFGLVVWFIGQSLFVLQVLCPWCMVTRAVAIPLFWLVSLHVLRSVFARVPPPARRYAAIG